MKERAAIDGPDNGGTSEKLLFSSEVVHSIPCDGEEQEVCASALASYHAADARVVVVLDSFVRKASPTGDGAPSHPPWLPGKTSVTEHAPRDEASQLAHDIFASWVRKVRRSIPRAPIDSFA
jgi:hypothetical protein